MNRIIKENSICLLVDGKRACNCEYSKDTEVLDDEFKAEICKKCWTILSYEKSVEPIKEKKAKTVKEKTTKVKKVKSKTVEIEVEEERFFEDIDGIEINTAYNEDCEKTMKRMPDGYVDYVFTSPPYNISADAFSKYEEYSDDLSQQEYLNWQVRLIREMLRVSRKHVFYNTQMLANNKLALITLWNEFKYQFKDIAIWNKKAVTPASSKGVMSAGFEFIFIFSNDKPEMRKFDDGNWHGDFKNVVEPRREKNEHADIHNATFPIDLPRTFIRKFGKSGDLWYDPFGGMFTTPKACIMEGRNWICSELSKKYYKQGLKNVSNKSSVGVIDFEPEEDIKYKSEEKVSVEQSSLNFE